MHRAEGFHVCGAPRFLPDPARQPEDAERPDGEDEGEAQEQQGKALVPDLLRPD
jgi:hypothetical protein